MTEVSGLNDDLDTNYLDVPVEDKGCCANLIRLVAGCVSACFKPRQILVILRLLKATTFCFLILAICADLMYIVFFEFLAANSLGDLLTGARDTIIRVYGVALAVLAILIELDIRSIVKHVSGLKNFFPRGLLLLLIATITNTHPLQSSSGISSSSGSYQNYADDFNNYADDLNNYANNGNDGDDLVVDDDANNYEYSVAASESANMTMPVSAMAFQMVVSYVLAGCAFVYLVLGLLCFDRFTSRAFLSQKDPVASTAIPQGDYNAMS